MHDDLGSKLNSIKLTTTMLQKKHTDSQSINDLNEVEQIAADLTVSMREMVWALNPKNNNIISFTNYMITYAKHFFEHSDIKVQILNQIENEDVNISGFVRKNVLLTIRELLNNVLKHSQSSCVTLYFNLAINEFLITITDDGIGISSNTILGNGCFSVKKKNKRL
jgi:signal transduction histidine kinase